MGENAAQTVTEIEEMRDRLEGDVQALEARLPSTARAAKRVVGVVAGGGVGGAAVWFLARRLRPSRRKERGARGKVVDTTKGTTVVQVMPVRVPDEWARALADGRWRPYAAAIAGAWVLLRLVAVIRR